MFGINKTLTKWLMIIVGGVVLICIGVCSGCASVDEVQSADIIEGEGAKKSVTDFDQKQTALAVKNEVDSSHKENHTETHTDNSITVEFTDEPENQALSAAAALPPPELPDLPVVSEDMVEKEEVSKIVDAKVKEREIMIGAGAKAQILAAEAKAEKEIIAAKAKSDAYVQEMEAAYKVKEQKLLTDLAETRESKSEAIANITEAKAKMQERVILAEGKVKENIIRAEAENLQLIVWIGGCGAAFLALVFLLMKSPLDWFKSVRKVRG